jgi:prepilin-type N-terminal cleavage/methylation domain-containing protein
MNARQSRLGFTLVELLIAIAIIGILMSLTVTAVTRAITRGRETASRLEINALSQAIEQYSLKYGDYPPDGSSEQVLLRHVRKIFPRISAQDLALLTQLTRVRGSNTFSEVAMDRGEALVFFLGGFSGNPLNPFTGEGGPLKRIGSDPMNIASYEYNGTRDNAFYDFDANRLTVARSAAGVLLSTDEKLLGLGSEPRLGGEDQLPAYLARVGTPTPVIYFDSRTYGNVAPSTAVPLAFNGYLAGNTEYGGVRPYMTNGNTGGATYADVKFHNDSTFQIISPGSDGVFGACVSVDRSNPSAWPVYFISQTGVAVSPPAPPAPVSPTPEPAPLIRGFQDMDWSPLVKVAGHLDNVTNFSSSTLESDLK